MKDVFLMTTAYSFALLLVSTVILGIRITNEKKNSADCHV